jgi:hypothetical protein
MLAVIHQTNLILAFIEFGTNMATILLFFNSQGLQVKNTVKQAILRPVYTIRLVLYDSYSAWRM